MFVRSSSKESSRLRSPSITSPDGKPTQEGWLWKFARSGKWQRRWFRLHGHYLKYYNPAGDPATGAEIGEVKAAYDLYDINKQKEAKRIVAMDGVELMIPFVHEVEKEDADGSTTKMIVEEVYQLKADSDAEAHAAHADGVLKAGDVLIEVNGQATLRSEPERWAMPFSDVLDLFQSDKIELRLARTKLSEEETAQNLAAIKMQAIHRGRAARRDSTQAPHTSGKQGKYSGRAAQRKASQLEEGPTK